MFKQFMKETYRQWLFPVILIGLPGLAQYGTVGYEIYQMVTESQYQLGWENMLLSLLLGTICFGIIFLIFRYAWSDFKERINAEAILRNNFFNDDLQDITFDPAYRKAHRRHLN